MWALIRFNIHPEHDCVVGQNEEYNPQNTDNTERNYSPFPTHVLDIEAVYTSAVFIVKLLHNDVFLGVFLTLVLIVLLDFLLVNINILLNRRRGISYIAYFLLIQSSLNIPLLNDGFAFIKRGFLLVSVSLLGVDQKRILVLVLTYVSNERGFSAAADSHRVLEGI